ncbi:MAG: hypothetical protein AAFY70_08900, partial [Bacteroidota bacterium]
KTRLLHKERQVYIEAAIRKAEFEDLPLKKNGWQFNWRKLYKVKGSEVFKLISIGPSNSLEGLIMLSLMYGEMVYMNNIEIAPHNYGSQGKYENAAGCLLAFGCQQGFERGEGNYLGYLSFESKSQLIPIYQHKYGATLALGRRMYIGPQSGELLIKKYLND